MRLTTSLSCLAALTLTAVTISHAAFINIPALYTCEPADIRVLAKGNYTIEGRDFDSHKLVFRAHVAKGVNLVTWDAVDLTPNSTAVITVTDQLGPSPTQLAIASASAIVNANPNGNTTCLLKADRDRKGATKGQKNMIPTIIGIVLGAFLLLVLLLVGGMMYRRKKEKNQKVENDSVDFNHGYPAGSVPAGGSYMARLVPGLKLQEARPLPRDPVLESEQANYASTRRGTHYYKSGVAPDVTGALELGGYRQSRVGGNGLTEQQQGASPYGYGSQHQQLQRGQNGGNPFASQHELPYQNQQYRQQQQASHQQGDAMYQQGDWDRSQTSFLTKKSSH